jgi:hypothetical protein
VAAVAITGQEDPRTAVLVSRAHSTAARDSEDERDDLEALIAEFSAADPTFPAALAAAEERLELALTGRPPAG